MANPRDVWEQMLPQTLYSRYPVSAPQPSPGLAGIVEAVGTGAGNAIAYRRQLEQNLAAKAAAVAEAELKDMREKALQQQKDDAAYKQAIDKEKAAPYTIQDYYKLNKVTGELEKLDKQPNINISSGGGGVGGGGRVPYMPKWVSDKASSAGLADKMDEAIGIKSRTVADVGGISVTTFKETGNKANNWQNWAKDFVVGEASKVEPMAFTPAAVPMIDAAIAKAAKTAKSYSAAADAQPKNVELQKGVAAWKSAVKVLSDYRNDLISGQQASAKVQYGQSLSGAPSGAGPANEEEAAWLESQGIQ